MNDTIISLTRDTIPKIAPKEKIILRKQNLSHADSAFMGYFPVEENHLFVVDPKRVKNDLRQTKFQRAEADSSKFFVEEIIQQNSNSNLVGIPRGETILHAQSSWILTIIFFAMIIFTFVRVRTIGYFSGLFAMLSSTIDYRQTVKFIEIQGRWTNRVMLTVSSLILPLIVYQIIITKSQFLANFNGIYLFLILFVIEMAYFLYKIIAYGLISFAFDSSKITDQIYNLRTLSINLFALLVFPFSVVFLFTPEKYYNILIITTLVLFVLISLWQFVKSFEIFSLNIVTLFYFILYLCAVEILPIIFLLKIYLWVGF